jgi:hypothetical protein
VLFTFPSQYLFAIGLSGVFSLAKWSWQIHAGFHVSRITQDTARYWIYFVYGTITLYGTTFQKFSTIKPKSILQSYNPNNAETLLVWAIPCSLATTWGITIVFFSSGYLDVSVLRVGILSDLIPSVSRVSPFGHLRIAGYLHLPVAYRSLSRPSSPLRAKASTMRP